MQHPRIALLLFVSLAGSGCGSKCKKGGTEPPNAIEQAASDVEHEVDQAGETVEKVGDDVEGAASDVVDAVDG